MSRETPNLTHEQTQTLAELEGFLNLELQNLRTKLQAQTSENIHSSFKNLESKVAEINEKAKQALEDALVKAQTIRVDALREMRIKSAEKSYRSTLQFNLKLLENFRQQCFL